MSFCIFFQFDIKKCLLYKNMAVQNVVVRTLSEQVDLKALKFIVRHFDDLYPSLGRFVDRAYCEVDKASAFSMIKNLLRLKLETDKIEYKFAGKTSGGRLYSVTPSLQGISRVVRHTIARDLYWDVDMKNAHPVLLSHYCHKNNIPCVMLDGYIGNRDFMLTEVMEVCGLSRDEAKRVFLSFLNGGKSKLKLPTAIRKLETELVGIRKKVMELEPTLLAKAKTSKGSGHWNLSGSCMNHLMCQMEDDVLQVMYRWLDTAGFRVGTFCFDGLMVYKCDKDINDALVNMERTIKDVLGVPVELTVKGMNEGIELTIPDDEDLDDIDLSVDGVTDEELALSRADLKKTYNGFDLSDPYYFHDFCAEFCGYYIDDFDKGKLEKIRMMKQLQRVLCVINTGKKVLVVKASADKPYMVVQAKSFYKDYDTQGFSHFHPKAISSVCRVLLNNSLVSEFPELACIDIQCIPYHDWMDIPKCIDNRKFNVHSPIKAKKVAKIDMVIVDLFLNHLRIVWANHDPELFEYFVSWFAQLVQRPHSKVGTAIVLVSSPGAGKNIISDIFQKFVLGFQNGVTVNGIDQVVGQFNSRIGGKLLVTVDEVSSLSGSEYHKAFDKLKNYITDENIMIEGKGLDAISMENNLRFLFTSNNELPIKVERNCRRYAVSQCSDEKIGDREYFDNMVKVLHTQTAGDHIFSYLLQRDITIDLRKIPSTKLRDELIDFSKPKPVQFIEQIKAGEFIPEWREGDLYQGMVKVQPLYDCFHEWCTLNGIRRDGTKQMFCKTINGVLGDPVVKTLNGKSFRMYSL